MVAVINFIIFLLINLKNGVYLQEFSSNYVRVNQPSQYEPLGYANSPPLPYPYHYQPQYRLPNYQSYGIPLSSSPYQQYSHHPGYPLHSAQNNYPQPQYPLQYSFNPFLNTQRDPNYYIPTEIIDVAENGKFDFYDELYQIQLKPVYEQSRHIDIEENLIKPQTKEFVTLGLPTEVSVEFENLFQTADIKPTESEVTGTNNLNQNKTTEENTTSLPTELQKESIEIQLTTRSNLPTQGVSTQTEESINSLFNDWFN